MKIIGLIILLILSVLALILVACLFVKIRLILTFVKPREGRGAFDVQIATLGGRVVKNLDFGISHSLSEDKKEKQKDNTKDNLTFVQKAKKYYNTFLKLQYTWSRSKRKVRKSIFAEKLMLNITFGLEDAAKTGIATGTLWAAVYNVAAFLSKLIRIAEPEISINPVYDDEYIESDGECIVTFRLVNIISILITLRINYYLINKKLTKKEKAAINYGNTN